MTLGDGVNDLDGSGGEFEYTMMLDSNTLQPDPQLIWFNTQTRANAFTEQFVLPRGATVIFKLKSPNAADTSVWVRVCIYEVGIFSILDDLDYIKSRLASETITTPSPETGTSGAGGGVYATTTGTGTGVEPGHC
jgi:hypothetical protein